MAKKAAKTFFLPLMVTVIVAVSFIAIPRAISFSGDSLKSYMRTFMILAADLQLEHIQGKNPEWDAIRATLKKMDVNLAAMRRADVEGAYRAYLDQVGFSLAQLKRMSRKRDPNISKGFDGLTETCLRCHSAHLPKESTVFRKK